jgi:hypothetical protein
MADWPMPEAMLPRAVASAAGWEFERQLEGKFEGRLDRELEGRLERDRMETGGNMNHGELDRILSKRDDIQPSSGFAASVMEAVREEAAAPPPIPFPWRRALPVLLLAGMVLVSVVIAGVETMLRISRGAATPEIATSLWGTLTLPTQGTAGTALAWTAAALLAAFVSVKLSMRLASGRA